MELSLVTICVLVCYINLNMGCPEENQETSAKTEHWTNKNEACNQDETLGVETNEMRILLIGKTGVGKSTTGNTLLGKNEFHAQMSAQSITNLTQYGKEKRFGKTLLVVDTPGLFDTGKTNDDVLLEITKCYAITSPGLHAVLLVLDTGRVTIESLKTVDLILSHFGEAVINYLIIVFTGRDLLNLQGMSIDDYVETLKYESSLTNLIQKINKRYIAFGLGKDKDEDVKQLLTMVDQMVKNNSGKFYHNEIYLAAERLMTQRLLDEKNRHAAEVDDLSKRHELEINRMKKKYDEHLNTQREEPPKAKEKVFSDIQNELDKILARQKLEREESAHNETKKESSETKSQTERQMRDSFRQKAVEGDNALLESLFNLLQSFVGFVISYVSPWPIN